MTHPIPPRGPLRAALPLALALALPALHAQTAAPAAPAGAATDPSAVARAQKEGDKVFKWILIQADKPAKKAEARPEAKAEARAPAPKPAPVARAKDEGITEKVEPIVPRPAPVVAEAAAPAKAEVAAPAPAPARQEVAIAAPSAAATRPAPPPEPEDDEDMPLQMVKQVDPEFAPTMMRRLQKGSVRVKFDVAPDGHVAHTEIVHTTSVMLNSSAQAAVAQWRFKPIHHEQSAMVDLAFNLNE